MISNHTKHKYGKKLNQYGKQNNKTHSISSKFRLEYNYLMLKIWVEKIIKKIQE